MDAASGEVVEGVVGVWVGGDEMPATVGAAVVGAAVGEVGADMEGGVIEPATKRDAASIRGGTLEEAEICSQRIIQFSSMHQEYVEAHLLCKSERITAQYVLWVLQSTLLINIGNHWLMQAV